MSRPGSIRAPATPPTNPFDTPVRSLAPSEDGQRSIAYVPSVHQGVSIRPARKFKSARFKGETYEKPWTQTKDPRQRWEKFIFWGCFVVGLAIGGVICALSWLAVDNHEYCLVLEDNFKTLDTSVWNFEIQRGGFGTGSFDWTTSDPKNVYVDSAGLHIVPTLTIESSNVTLEQLLDEHVLNLTTAGTCTSKEIDMCSIRSNKTAGTIINPVQSARINTKGKKTIRYGKVEVVAKMPKGNWLWPAIWMMPEADKYGTWPASGEIDIAESRGNHGDEYPDGRDSVGATLHWGPLPSVDAFWKTTGKHNLRRTDYTEDFHTYGLEWDEDYMFMYIDSRLRQVMFINFNKYKSMWDRGGFGKTILNKSAVPDPWSHTHRRNTPFDEHFFLILNVAVGGTNGFFKDGVASKPWGDASLTAPREFWEGRNQWLPTWGAGDSRGMTVRSVKMWSNGPCGGKK